MLFFINKIFSKFIIFFSVLLVLTLSVYSLTVGGNSSSFFDGIIDEFSIYTIKFSPEQVAAFYNNQTNVIVNQTTTLGENWSACVTPNDGYQDGVTNCSNNVTIGGLSTPNNPPNVTDVILKATSPNNYTTDNLTLYYNTSDPDNDDVKAIINWYKNGT